MKTDSVITGNRESGEVRIDGVRLDPLESQKLRNHSPDGFSWAYHGSGPSQLALALLLEVMSPEQALNHYQGFKRDVIATLPESDFVMSASKIWGWVRENT